MNEILEHLHTNLNIFKYQLDIIDSLINFAEKTDSNSFINDHLTISFKSFIVSVCKLQHYTLELFPHETRDDLYIVPKLKGEKSYEEAEIRLNKERNLVKEISEDIKTTYSEFRQKIKQTLYI